ncbi:MAG: hypothetical protein H8K04_19665 [Nitrospira sp.]
MKEVADHEIPLQTYCNLAYCGPFHNGSIHTVTAYNNENSTLALSADEAPAVLEAPPDGTAKGVGDQAILVTYEAHTIGSDS